MRTTALTSACLTISCAYPFAAIELNVENVLGILDEGFGHSLEAAFHDDLKRAREFRLEEWRRRGTWEKVKEWVASRLAEQY